mgnify:CR=1 FL=1
MDEERLMKALDPIYHEMHISERGRYACHTYSDLVLTEEMMDKGRWDMLQHGSTARFNKDLVDFLEENPDSLDRYTEAVFASFTSGHAMNQGLTNSELMRERMHVRAGVYVTNPFVITYDC